jgi:hypothetical protein
VRSAKQGDQQRSLSEEQGKKVENRKAVNGCVGDTICQVIGKVRSRMIAPFHLSFEIAVLQYELIITLGKCSILFSLLFIKQCVN